MLDKGPYKANQIEGEILDFWLKNNFYKPEYNPKQEKIVSTNEMKKDKRPCFCIICPPPNAYDRPHLGNVSGYAYQDLLGRYWRMHGHKVLLFPGKDHAGIQGEIVVLRDHFKPQGLSKKNLTREQFYQKTYQFFEKNMTIALKDEQRIGLSADYDRNVFTLHPTIVKTILETFVRLHQDKQIYKGVRIVNWCPSCLTALADIDTEKKDHTGKLYYIKYPVLGEKQHVWRLSFYDQKTLAAMISGQKTIETRALNPEEKPDRYFGDIKSGDIIVAVDKNNHQQTHLFKVTKTSIFKDLTHLWNEGDLDKISSGSTPKTRKELEHNYNKLAPDYAKKANKNGLIALSIAPLNASKDFKHYLTVATTRPETMLGDTAVVVNPKDKRYKKLVGRQVLLPLTNRAIPIITSPMVDLELGTGVLKLTPAHAPEDYEIMLNWNNDHPKNKLGYVNVIDKKAKMVGPIGQFFGLDVDKARQEVVNSLDKLGLFTKSEDQEQRLAVCERCKTVIEPQMSSQWFIRVAKIKAKAVEVVQKGKVKIHPQYMSKKYFHWMENLRDWPISRSLWWGYRVPTWYKGAIKETIDDSGQIAETIANQPVKDLEDAIKKGLAKISLKSPGKGWIQDDNVFDTWFSSGQWPYATLMKEDLMDTFYPTQVMETGYDILPFWVSRMIMLGLYRTKQVPFTDVYLHGMINAPDGQKMSKSKHNVVNMDDVVEKYGADVLRLFYIVGNKAGANYRIDFTKIEGYHRFLNKIWNATRFIFNNLEDIPPNFANLKKSQLKLTSKDKQLLQSTNKLMDRTEKMVKSFRFGIVAVDIQQQFWHDFCDIYLEEVKERLYTKDKNGKPKDYDKESRLAAQWTLYQTLRTYLHILHPYIPFITEKIWQEFPKTKNDKKSLMYSQWSRV